MPAPPAARLFRVLVPFVVLLLCATRNLPWRLADYDQAKQAFVALEIADGGNLFFQHTPVPGRLATKPPLVGWLSAGLHRLPGVGKWELAWRLPSMLATAALVVMLWRAGRTAWPAGGGWLAAGAFGLNLLAPRLATLARTDMVLTLCVTGAGLLVWRPRLEDRPWSAGERWALAGLLTAGMLTKGPVVYAFLLPGLGALFLWERRAKVAGALPNIGRDERPRSSLDGEHGTGAVDGGSGRFEVRDERGRSSLPGTLWPWLVPLAVFALWVVAGCLTQPGFYEQVIGREFLGRFDYSDHALHIRQPVWYYTAGLLGRWAPWSLLLLGTVFVARPAWRATLRAPAGRWLACWAAGGLALMSLVPSKRTDRIFPVVPPLCLLLVTVVGRSRPAGVPGVERWAVWTTAAALAVSLTTTGYEVHKSFRRHEDSLDRFGRYVRRQAVARGWRCELATGRHVHESDETMLVCLHRQSWLNNAAAVEAWRGGHLDALVLQTTTLEELRPALGGEESGFTVAARMDVARRQDVPYLLILRRGGTAVP